MIEAFVDELEKISVAAAPVQQAKPGEAKSPVTPTEIKAKSINPSTRKGTSTNYSRSNVEAPGTDVGITLGQKLMAPPPVRV